MKIALFSDIHANIDALYPVFDDIYARQPDVIYCLGDLVGYAPYPNEVVELIRSKGIPVIAGNYDQGVGLYSNDCSCAYIMDEDKSPGVDSITFTYKMIEDRDGTIRHAINIGSAGKPKDGDPRACYAMLEWDGDLDLKDPAGLEVDFIRVEYDEAVSTAEFGTVSKAETLRRILVYTAYHTDRSRH